MDLELKWAHISLVQMELYLKIHTAGIRYPTCCSLNNRLGLAFPTYLTQIFTPAMMSRVPKMNMK